jgi:hypothetical protein
MRLSLRSFSKYIPADYVRNIVESEKEAQLGAKKLEITVGRRGCVCFTLPALGNCLSR